jgi:hypothetical protein
MVVRNKFYRIMDKYRSLLIKRYRKTGNKTTLKTNRVKNKILDFYLKNNRWPNRRSKNKNEKRLGSQFENYISKQNGCYDPSFRRITMFTGRKSNNKRKHDRKVLKKEILEFIEKYGRVPNRYDRPQEVNGESKLRSNLDRYTQKYNDKKFLGEIYSLDPCHRSGIPMKFRPLINNALDVDKPLIRMFK